MPATDEGLEIRDDPEAQRFEARLGEYLAVAAYRRAPGVVEFTHTEVPPAIRGRGVAGRLVRAALDQARERGDAVVPLCSYVAWYIGQHPQYRELVPPRHRHLLP